MTIYSDPSGGGSYGAYNTTTPSTTWLYGSFGYPSVDAVNQGGIGDCWFLSPLMCMATFDPSFIESMITADGNGYYTVDMYLNGVLTPVTIGDDLPNDASSSNGDGHWASLIEKAYAALVGSYTAMNGNFADTAFRSLTDQTCSDISISSFNTGLEDATIRSALALNEGVVIYSDDLFIPQAQPSNSGLSGTFPTIDYNSSTGKGEGLVVGFASGAHAYAVVGYDSTTGNLIVRNPWGYAGSSVYNDDGVSYQNAYVSTSNELTNCLKAITNAGNVAPNDGVDFFSEFEISPSDLQYFYGGVITNSALPLPALPNPATVNEYLSDIAAYDQLAGGIQISDTASAVAADFNALNADSHITSITLTDSGIPVLNLTTTEAGNDTAALGKIGNEAFEVLVGAQAHYYVGGNGSVGTSITLSASNATVSLKTNSRMDLTGSDDTVTAGAGSNLGVVGSDDKIALGAGDGLWLGGNGAVGISDLVSGSGASVHLCANSRMDLTGSDDTVTAGAGSNLGVVGSDDTIALGAGDGLWLGGNGAVGISDPVSGSGASVHLCANSRMDLTGSDDTVTAGAGSNLGVVGSDDTIALGAGDGLWLGGNGAVGISDLVSGSGVSVHLQANSRMDLAGSDDGVTAGAGSNLGVVGSDDTIAAGDGDGVWLGGSSDIVSVGVDDAIHDFGHGMTIKVAGSAGMLSVYGFSSDVSGVIDLLNGVGGYASAASTYAALSSDGNGGSLLSLGAAGSIDIVGVASSALSAANFKIG